MLLRTSSTPISHTFFFSDSPTSSSSSSATTHLHKPPDNSTAKFSVLLPHPHPHPQPQLISSSCNSSPTTNSSSGHSAFSPKLIHRALSDSNLKGLSSINFNTDEFFTSKSSSTRSSSKQKITMLRTEPSFSVYHNPENGDDDVNNDDLVLGIEKARIDSVEFSFGKRSMDLIKEVDDDEEGKDESFVNSGIPNLGIGGNGSNGGRGADSKSTNFDESGDLEGYYKRMLAQDPSNALFLRNYAHLLQSKGDLNGAEEYYFLATLADPKDGEILFQYAKLVWELHHDQERALIYFETAARVAPEDSHVLAAYASFLWEINDEEDEDFVDDDRIQDTAFEQEERSDTPKLHLAAGLGVGVAEGYEFGDNVEDYYKRKLKENPSNPLFLRNYAQFLSQSKGDLQGAELYYLRAMLADPGDGEVISQYAKLVWELHHDQHKASQYFERAVEAAPGNSYVLAARAKFLWEADEDEPTEPIFPGMITATA